MGTVTNLCTDQSDQTDQREVIRVTPIQGMGLRAFDQTDQQKSQNLTVENAKNPDQFDHFDQLELDSAQGSSFNLITSTDQTDQPTDQPALIENEPVQPDQLPQVGDLVVANSTAIWYRSGSDKVPWQQVPKQLRQASAIQLTSFGFDLFHELTQPSKVLALSQDRERVKVRNQQTGRTSILKTADVGVLRPANAVSNVVRRD